MNKSTKYLSLSFVLVILFVCISACKKNATSSFKETVKVALREVGHQLLLTNQDSTSIVKPVIALTKNKYQLSFENSLAIQPDSLVKLIRNSFEKANLPQEYITEVSACNQAEVAYSYAMKQEVEKGIIPCRGRQLNKHCYIITVNFTSQNEVDKNTITFWILISVVVLVLLIVFLWKFKKKSNISAIQDSKFITIGSYRFYPEQNKLIKEAKEISLSKKECEILALFVEKPNVIITREELTKKVWEDHGVVVGRSLDTYISKLRKKLQDDKTIQLTNIHGVGYKLAVT